MTGEIRTELADIHIGSINEVCFQQDGVRSHMGGESINLWRQIPPGWLIFALGDTVWPPRSPDFSEPYYFLWSYLKSCVYVTKTRNNEEFKVCFHDEIAGIAEVLRSGIKDFHRTCSEVIASEGALLWCPVFAGRTPKWVARTCVCKFCLFFFSQINNLPLKYVSCVWRTVCGETSTNSAEGRTCELTVGVNSLYRYNSIE
jgi:hypothetical protein